jgi:gas vesicle protein
VGQDPDQIRQEIVETRERMSETVDAMGYRANAPARAKDFVSDKKDTLVSKVSGGKDQLTSRVSGATPDTGQVRDTAAERGRQAVGMAQSNPLGLAIGAAAFGFVAGLVLPSTRMEDERLGEMADQLKGSATEMGQEALERGKQVAQETAQTAMETAKQSGSEHAQEMGQSAQQQTDEMRQSAQEQTEGTLTSR